MNVKRVYQYFKSKNISVLCLVFAFCFLLVGLSVFDIPNNELRNKKSELTLRLIGHKLLQKSGDLTSVVPPIEFGQSQSLNLNFSQPTIIDPDHLVELSLNNLNTSLTGSYIVNVIDLRSNEMVYGFEVNHFDQGEISCLGRILPQSEYRIEYLFYDQHLIPITQNVPAISLASASLLLFLFGLSFAKDHRAVTHLDDHQIHLDLDLNLLNYKGQQVELTSKEMRIISLLYEKRGQLVERDYLLNEVWIKEGTVTSRSLDMYISRLRKKLEIFPHMQIVNQRGKGYFLKLAS